MASLYDDPRLYDLLFEAEPHSTFYKALARRQKGSVLELACGTGQLLIPIADLGFRSVGVDLHPAMLSAARGRAHTTNADVSLIEGAPPVGNRFACAAPPDNRLQRAVTDRMPRHLVRARL
jgi:SAM-dependent methyltransferase